MTNTDPGKPPILRGSQVVVNFNYVYTHKSKKVEIFKGEVLQLLQKTNEHWWKCLRVNQPKSFYVPATYVSVLEEDLGSVDDDLEINHDPCDNSNEKFKDEHPFREANKDLDDTQSLSSVPSNIITFSTSTEQLGDHSSGSFFNSGCSNHGVTSIKRNNSGDKVNGCGSISRKHSYWSSSLEELAKQIVFPGQASIYFNNPSFKSDSEKDKIESKDLNAKTPLLSSSSDLDNDDLNSSNEGNTSGPHGGTTDEEIDVPRQQDLIRELPNNWAEYKCRNSDRIFYYNTFTKSRSWKPPRLSKEESNNNVFQIPNGWTQTVDECNGTVSFVNQSTGSKWFSSTDPEGKLYFWEQNSSKSSWVLPSVADSAGGSGRPTSYLPVKQHHDSVSSDASDVENTVKQKRHSTGDRDYLSDWHYKSQSALDGSLRSKGDSLPRQASIWKDGKVHIVHESALHSTKYIENNKKVRKNWTPSWVVLTHAHLSFFKDQKCLRAQSIKSDLEVDLHNSKLEEFSDKSSRKNVFQIACRNSGLELLCQTSSPAEHMAWCDHIRKVISSLLVEDDMPIYKGDTIFLEPNGRDSNKRKSTMKSSSKLRITADEEPDARPDAHTIRSQLKKFFNRRPPRDSLVKKGIYKDEPVFGCLLEKLAQNDRSPIPIFVDECINVIESKEENLKTDGIYRASGNLSQVQKIRLQVDQNNMTVLHSEEDVHVLAGALKLFFREMREPIIPSQLFNGFLEACQLLYREDNMAQFNTLIGLLPKPNYATLKRLLRHLLQVSQYSEFNRMQIPNLAIVFGPTLMWNNAESANMAIDLMQQNYVVEILLKHFDHFFS